MAAPPHSERPTWIEGDAPLARWLARPLIRFLRVEASGGALLLAATAVALLWANSPWSAGYHSLWSTDLALDIGSYHLAEDLRHWVNDGLMALYFFVVGLEIKRELVTGQLSDRRDATLPVVAAIGGMAVPAVLYLALNAGGDGAVGWGIPMATDIAFAVGVLALLGDRVPAALKVLLLSLAIVDDIGAIVVIALVYTDQIDGRWLAAAAAGIVLVVLLRQTRVWSIPVYALVGATVWLCTLESGIHATIAGVLLGLLAPARPVLPELEGDQPAESVSVAERLEQALHPWTSYLVLPVFALANAGIPLGGDALRSAAGSTVTLGVVVGLLLGKIVGVSGAIWLAVRLGIGRLPDGVGWGHVTGLAALAGIGFTVSIFITDLAFDGPAFQDDAKIGVLLASGLAAGLGVMLLRRAGRPPS